MRSSSSSAATRATAMRCCWRRRASARCPWGHHPPSPRAPGRQRLPGPPAGDAISPMARMAAIVDVYDAITADRCYHKGMPAAGPAQDVGMEQRPLRPEAAAGLHALRRDLPGGQPGAAGIRAAGGGDRAERGQPAHPRLRVFFSTKSNGYIKPRTPRPGPQARPRRRRPHRVGRVPGKMGRRPQRFLLAE